MKIDIQNFADYGEIFEEILRLSKQKYDIKEQRLISKRRKAMESNPKISINNVSMQLAETTANMVEQTGKLLKISEDITSQNNNFRLKNIKVASIDKFRKF